MPQPFAIFRQRNDAQEIYRCEIEALIRGLTGAGKVIVLNTVLRWSERAGDKSAFVNSGPFRTCGLQPQIIPGVRVHATCRDSCFRVLLAIQ